MNINPYDAPKDASDDETRFPSLGRSDCPVCATPQRRVSLINPRHKCRACGSVLQLKLPGWINALFVPVTLAGYLIVAPYTSRINLSPNTLLVYYLIFLSVLSQVTSLAIGRIHAKSAKSQTASSVGFILKSLAWVFVFLGTLVTVMVYSISDRSVMPIVMVVCFCAVMFLAFMLLAAKTSPQGHLEMPTLLRPTRSTLIGLVVAVALGTALGVVIPFS